MRLFALLLALLPCSLLQAAPLTSSFTATGNVSAEIAAYPLGGSPGAGVLNLGTIPAGSNILSATLYAHNWFASPAISATFAGNALGAAAPFSSDTTGSGTLYAYRWDVTSFVTGNGAYSANYSGATNTYGLALAVAFEHPSLPGAQVIINDGADQVASGNTGDAAFAGVQAGAGDFWLYAQADNAQGQTNEQILFNGAVVGGPIDANLGPFASLFNIPVSTISGVNNGSVVSPSDLFGIHIAALVSPFAVPEPGSLGVFGLSLLIGGAYLRRRKRRS